MRLITLIIFIATFQLSAQDLSGRWEGSITKKGNNDSYYYSINVEQSDFQVKGESYISYRDTTWNAKKEWRGYIGKNRLQIIETGFIRYYHDTGAYWLLIRGVLKYDKQKDMLHGWVDAYDPYTKSILQNHDYIELYRKKQNVAYEKSIDNPNDIHFMPRDECSTIAN